MRRVCVAFLLLLVATAPGYADDQEAAANWLKRMAEALETGSYQGTFVQIHGNRLGRHSIETLRITHVNTGDGIAERLYAISGRPREIIRDKQEIRVVSPGNQSMLIDQQVPRPLLPTLPVDKLLAADASYTLSLGAKGRVAGRLVQLLRITPKDQYRYGYRIWLDIETGLPLSTVLHNTGKGKQVLAQLMFTEIRYGEDVNHEELESRFGEERFVTIQSEMPPTIEASPQESPRWKPSKIPAGFRLASHSHDQNNDASGVFEHLVYSDGLATVSVYIESAVKGKQALKGTNQIGALNFYAQQTDGLQVTAIGEVPKATLELLASSVSKIAEEAPANPIPAAAEGPDSVSEGD